MKFNKETRQIWRKNTLANIEKLNAIVGNEFTGENYYDLGFRGKNHRPVLLLDDNTVASGMLAINQYIYDLMKYYHLW